MDADNVREVSERDQLWASLRQLRPEIEALAAGTTTDSDRERQIANVLARIVLAELDFRARDTE